MTITAQHQEFNYYCLDREKPVSEEFVVTYNDGSVIKKILYKIGLRANIKHEDCFVLYTESESDLDDFIPTETFYNYQESFFTSIFSIEEIKTLIKRIKTINIFEFTSLLDFTNIYGDYKDFLESNWSNLNMDELIEI